MAGKSASNILALKSSASSIWDLLCLQLGCSLRGTHVDRWGERRHPFSGPELLNKPWQSIQQQMPPPACPDLLFPAWGWFHGRSYGEVFLGFSSVMWLTSVAVQGQDLINWKRQRCHISQRLSLLRLCKLKSEKKVWFILKSTMSPTLSPCLLLFSFFNF